jgi:hypothetical protein
MERKITLMVFSLASVLVLAGFLANEKAYAGNGPSPPGPLFGDFTCWISVDPGQELVHPFLIEDQFGVVDPIPDTWEQVEYCTANIKNGDPESSPYYPELDQHYQSWLYDQHPAGPGTGVIVDIEVLQFDDLDNIVLGNLDQIMLPATKYLDSGPVDSRDTFHHWNCYNIEGQANAPDSPNINLETQHGPITEVMVGEPFLFCAPMLKDEVFGDKDLDEHMICYNIDTRDPYVSNPALPGALSDQLTDVMLEPGVPFDFEIDFLFGNNGLEKLCVPALKTIQDIVIGGFDIPINTSSLLLAGVSSVSMWMIPVVIAGVGIGIFVIKRRN